MLADKTIKEFIDILASAAPTPGGGGASALVGAIGVALGNMVGSLTVGKKKYADVQDDIKALKAKSDALQDKLLALIDADAEAFEPLSKAYGLPSGTDEEKAEKARIMEEALVVASGAPLDIMEAIGEGVALLEEFEKKGTWIAISDVGCGAVICQAALRAVSLNVFINTKSMKNREKAKELENRANALLDDLTARSEKVFTNVKERLK
jgi:formiminotetrahydrofolate cyclodeaminase